MQRLSSCVDTQLLMIVVHEKLTITSIYIHMHKDVFTSTVQGHQTYLPSSYRHNLVDHAAVGFMPSLLVTWHAKLVGQLTVVVTM